MSALSMPRPAAVPAGMRPQILCVDDEPQVLEGLAANLRRNYDVTIASSGAQGLDLLARTPFVVVVSDMRMPVMNGATFLARAREIAPDTVRMLLTGQTDLDAAIAAVNQGGIFRFLTKPCPRDVAIGAIDAAAEQHRLIKSERVLLEQTLRGSIKALVDVLALANPTAFGRANRIKQRVVDLAAALGLGEVWQLEVAALLCRLGLIALPDDLCEKLARGHQLSDAEHQMVLRVPAITDQLLANIPRIDTVREIMATHVRPPPRTATAAPERRLVEIGAHILRVALDLEDHAVAGADERTTLENLRARGYDAKVVAAVERMFAHTELREIVEIALPGLRVGMVFANDVYLASGTLLVASGYQITAGFIARVANFTPGMVRLPMTVFAPHLLTPAALGIK